MAVKFPQADAPRNLRGAADLWDTPAGLVIGNDYFSTDSGVVNVSVGESVTALDTLSATGGDSPPTTITISGNTTPADTYQGCTDMMIREVAPTTAYGAGVTAADFEISNWAADDRQFGLIRFEAISNIPAGATITAAKWKYWPSYTNATIILQLHRCLRAWVENQATWNIYSTGNNWGTAGALGAGDKSATLSGSSTWTVAENQVTWKEITSAQFIADVQDMVDTPANNQGWILDASASAGYSTYCQIPQRDREFSFDHRHILEITYTVGGTSYSVTIPESSTALDTLSSNKTAPLSITESGTLAETISKNLSVALAMTESGTAQDTVNRTLLAAVTIFEVVTALESVTKTLITNLNIIEIASATDAQTEVLAGMLVISETASAQDTLINQLRASLSIVESATAQDTQNTSATYGVVINESATAQDTLNNQLTALLAITDSATIVDSVSKNLSVVRAVAESATVSETINTIATLIVNMAESGNIIDTTTAILVLLQYINVINVNAKYNIVELKNTTFNKNEVKDIMFKITESMDVEYVLEHDVRNTFAGIIVKSIKM